MWDLDKSQQTVGSCSDAWHCQAFPANPQWIIYKDKAKKTATDNRSHLHEVDLGFSACHQVLYCRCVDAFQRAIDHYAHEIRIRLAQMRASFALKGVKSEDIQAEVHPSRPVVVPKRARPLDCRHVDVILQP